MPDANETVEFVHVENGERSTVKTVIIREAPVSLTVNGEVWLTFMCTPIQLEAMAVGFLFNEGLIENLDQIADVRVCPAGDNVDVWSQVPLSKPAQWRRTSGCTGGQTSVDIEKAKFEVPVILNGRDLHAWQVHHMIEDLFKSQELYRQSGGVHTSILTDGEGHSVSAEDIGRHNTLDKIAGRCLLEDIHLEHRYLLTTGRISSEMLQKAARLGAAVVISRTSPSSLSISLAEQYGITLVGYARRDRFNIYTHPHRIAT
jgi:FdhD protein